MTATTTEPLATTLGTEGQDDLWVLVRVGQQHFVIPSAAIIEMVRVPEPHHIPHAPPGVRGIAKMRGQVGVLVELRSRFNLEPARDERDALTALLHAREQDHRDWVDDLEASVRERRPFTRTLDPHACAFGKWYDQFKAPTPELEWFMPRFAEPHAAIHAAGGVVTDLMQKERFLVAEETVQGLRQTLFPQLLHIFERARHLVETSAQEVAVIVAPRGHVLGLIVDEVEGIDRLKADSLTAQPGQLGTRDIGVLGTARLQGDDRLVVVLDVEALAGDYAGVG